MDVFIVKYEVINAAGEQDTPVTEIIGVYSSYEKGKKAYTFYLDAIEKNWREEDRRIGTLNTFNRFSEPMDALIEQAVCTREDTEHTAALIRMPLE